MASTDTTTQHTPTPWSDNGNEIVDARGVVVGGAITEADAEFMLRACNSHEQLVALTRRAQEILAAYLPPDGSSGQEAITALLELFDGPESRVALAAAGAA